MGLACSPRVLSKVLKTVFAVLRRNGHISTAYIDDSCLQGDTYIDCQHNIRETVQLMDSLGFTIHPSKSVLIPVQTNYICGIYIMFRNNDCAINNWKEVWFNSVLLGFVKIPKGND